MWNELRKAKYNIDEITLKEEEGGKISASPGPRELGGQKGAEIRVIWLRCVSPNKILEQKVLQVSEQDTEVGATLTPLPIWDSCKDNW